MPDQRFGNYTPGLSAPAVGGFAITPGDTEFAQWTRAVWVGNGGNINVVYSDDTQTVITNVPAGTRLDVRAKKVLAASTTATDLVGWY